jgi:hypothetical protein
MLQFELSKLRAELNEEIILEIIHDYHDGESNDNKKSSEEKNTDDSGDKSFSD